MLFPVLTGQLPTKNTCPSPSTSSLACSNKKRKNGLKCGTSLLHLNQTEGHIQGIIWEVLGNSICQRVNGLRGPQAFQNADCTEDKPRLSPQLRTIRPPSALHPQHPPSASGSNPPSHIPDFLPFLEPRDSAFIIHFSRVKTQCKCRSSKRPSLGILSKVVPQCPTLPCPFLHLSLSEILLFISCLQDY